MSIHRYNLSDFVTIQRQSFFELLEKGIIEEFSKRNAITNLKKDLKFQFYPQYYVLTPPEYTPQEAIIKNKSYTSKLFVPAQLINMKTNKKVLKWFYIGNLPLMTKRGHFILNGATRVIVNQILRSPGIYYQQKVYENYEEKWSQKPDDSYKRFYADLICMRGTWLRIEIDKYKNIWAQTKKGAKIPIYWLLIAMGLSEKKIFKTILDSYRLLGNLSNYSIEPNAPDNLLMQSVFETENNTKKSKKQHYNFVKNPPEAWQEIFKLVYSVTPSSIQKAKTKSTVALTKPSLPEPVRTLRYSASSTSTEGASGAKQRKEQPFLATPPKMQERGLVAHAPVASASCASAPYASAKRKKVQSASSTFGARKKRTALTPLLRFAEGTTVQVHKKRTKKREPQKGVAVLPSGEKNLFIKTKSKFYESNLADEGRKWLYNKFMNPRAYDLGKQGRLAFNRKLDLNISESQTTLTGLDLLYATDYLLKVEKGLFKIDDIDHLKNRRVRTSGELIQIQIAVGIVRLEKTIREKINKSNYNDLMNYSESKNNNYKTETFFNDVLPQRGRRNPKGVSPPLFEGGVTPSPHPEGGESRVVAVVPSAKRSSGAEGFRFACTVGAQGRSSLGLTPIQEEAKRSLLTALSQRGAEEFRSVKKRQAPLRGNLGKGVPHSGDPTYDFLINLVNSKAFNSAIREFFGTSPLSQFMDQINPLAELTHKRRLSSMGPGGVTRDTATLAIRGIHPTHYGRICPIETPEGKNTGLVNSMTTYARVNTYGIIESPFYKVYKGQVQKNTGMLYFSALQEEKIKLAAADIFVSPLGFLPKSFIPVRIAEDFTKISRSQVQFVGVSALQMISIAASLIPFLEHDDANRALMGSNMQRQAVPLIRPERPIVGTGLEARAVSDSGHSILAKFSGLVTYVSSNKIIVQKNK